VSDYVLLGPCRCQGCGDLVVWLKGRFVRPLHSDGLFGCEGDPARRTQAPRVRVTGRFATKDDYRRAYNREWMRRKRAAEKVA